LKSDVIPLQFQIPKRIDVFELLLEQWKTMTPPACWLPAPYTEASSKTETDLKSDVIPLHIQNPKKIDVFELLLEQWNTMTPPACWLPALAKSKKSIPRGEF
jgi:hypothetical protein